MEMYETDAQGEDEFDAYVVTLQELKPGMKTIPAGFPDEALIVAFPADDTGKGPAIIAFSKDEWSRNAAIEFIETTEIAYIRKSDRSAQCGPIDTIVKLKNGDAVVMYEKDAPKTNAWTMIGNALDGDPLAEYIKNEEPDALLPENMKLTEAFNDFLQKKGESADRVMDFIFALNDRVEARLETIPYDETKKNGDILDALLSQEEKDQIADLTELYDMQYLAVCRPLMTEYCGIDVPALINIGRIAVNERIVREVNVKKAFLSKEITNEIESLVKAVFRNGNSRSVVILDADDTSIVIKNNGMTEADAAKAMLFSSVMERLTSGCTITVREHTKDCTEMFGIDFYPYAGWTPISSYEMREMMTTLPDGRKIPPENNVKYTEIKRKKF